MKIGTIYIGRQEVTLFIVLLDLLILFFYRLYLLTYFVPLNVEYKKLLVKTDELRKQNQIIKNLILHHKALSTIEKKAIKEGFVDAEYYYLK